MKQSYTKKLEKVIKQMMRPLQNVPLNLVIESISGHKILKFDKNDSKDKIVLSKLMSVAKLAGQTINKKGIIRKRPNEAGNDIENFVKEALKKLEYKATTPISKSGKKKSMGYPDIEFVDEFERVNYLECKTFNMENMHSSQRSFYLSPSENFKITKDAHHFVISFEIFVKGKKKNNNIYNCKSWKILSIENMDVNVKYEFNTDNKRMYIKEFILAEGKI